MRELGHRGDILVDFDGTLAEHRTGQLGDLGPPIQEMVDKVKEAIAKGYGVKIFTARASHKDPEVLAESIAELKAWSITWLGVELDVTNAKDFNTIAIWDDRAKGVIRNSGRFVEEELKQTLAEGLQAAFAQTLELL